MTPKVMTSLGFPHILQYLLKLYKQSEAVGLVRGRESQ